MWYKRYGYRHPSRNGGIGCIGATLAVVTALTIAFLVSMLLKTLWFLLLVFPISFIGFWFAERQAFSEGDLIRKRRYQYHIKKAQNYVFAGKEDEALNSIRKIKIYGELPVELEKYEKNRLG